jgi:hypothetical protein
VRGQVTYLLRVVALGGPGVLVLGESYRHERAGRDRVGPGVWPGTLERGRAVQVSRCRWSAATARSRHGE